MAILPKAKRSVSLIVERNGQAIEKQVVPAAVGKFELGETGMRPIMRPQLVTVSPRRARERSEAGAGRRRGGRG